MIPLWFKQNLYCFPRVYTTSKKPIEIVSTSSTEVLQIKFLSYTTYRCHNCIPVSD